MRKIVLISCGSKKLNRRAKAKDMYQSPLFKYSLEYARKLNPDKIYILSAHYHLLDLETEIETYDVTLGYVKPEVREKKPNLKVLSKDEKIEWGKQIISELSKVSDIKNDEFIILAGQSYIKPMSSLYTLNSNIKEPLKGVGLFDRISYLKKLIG